MAKVQSDSHWIICLGIVALFRFPFSFHVLLFFSFFPLFQCICCCCMKVGQGNAGAALELIGLGSLCGTDSCRRRYGKQKVCPRRSQVRIKRFCVTGKRHIEDYWIIGRNMQLIAGPIEGRIYKVRTALTVKLTNH